MGSAGKAFGSKPYAGIGSTLNQGGKFIGQIGAAMDNGIKNASTTFFSSALKPSPQDAPTPSGIAGFKAGVPSTYGTPAPAKPSLAQPSASQTSQSISPVSQPRQPFVAQNPGAGMATAGALSTAAAQSPGGSQYNPTPTGAYPNASSPSPFINSLNTQQNYASGQGNNDVNRSVGTLQNQATGQSPEVLKAEQQYNQLAQQSPILQAEVAGNPNVASEVASGRAQVLGNQLAGQLQGASQNVTNALTGQGQNITAGTNAASAAQAQQSAQQSSAANIGSLTQPQAGAAFFGSPVSGETVGSGSVVNNAVQNALQMVRAGADPTSPAVTGPLNSLGATAVNAFNSALNGQGGYNPTASSAAAQQNAAQGATYQGQGAQLSTTLKQLDTLTPTVTNFLNASGLNNSSSPFFNKSVNAYLQQAKNPADIASLNAMLADVKTYTAQILGSSGLNPTEVSATVNSFDPGGLNADQLTAFLKNLSNLGQTRLAPLQQTAAASYGNTTASPYGGQAATPSTNSTLGPATTGSAASNVNNPVIQALIGSGLNTLGGIEGAITGIASHILQ